jgi:hypothetical protein
MTSESKKVDDNAPEVLFSARRFQEALKTEALGRSFVYFRETETTMEDTKLFWGKGAASGTLVLAESQTKGRGRQGRQWSSLPKGNLYFTALLECPTADLAKFGFAVPVAVARACADEKVSCRLLIYCGSQLLMLLAAGRSRRASSGRTTCGWARRSCAACCSPRTWSARRRTCTSASGYDSRCAMRVRCAACRG